MHAQHFLIAEREWSIYESCRFDIGRFRAEPTNYENVHTYVTHLHIEVPRITPVFLTLLVIQNLKTDSKQMRRSTEILWEMVTFYDQ